jgi:hypothetical protein
MNNPWLQGTVFILAALVIGFLITLGSTLLRSRHPDGPNFVREPKPPLPRWGQVARETFWVTLGVSGWFALSEGIFDLETLREGFWWWVRLANGVLWIGAIIVWVWALNQGGRGSASEKPSV